jgi:hypothetical protein
MSSKASKTHDPKAPAHAAAPAESYASEADFDDTIAQNRALPILDPGTLPARPPGFKPTDPDTRNRRLRRLADDHRAEGLAALQEASARDLQALLGKHAPDPKRAAVLAERMAQSETLLARAERLLEYAQEIDEIVRSDALVFLEVENKKYTQAAEDEPNLADQFSALIKLFEARSAAIAEGIARAKKASAPADAGGARPAAE